MEEQQDETYIVIHQSYVEAQQEALERSREEQALKRALRDSQAEADAALARRLHQEEQEEEMARKKRHEREQGLLLKNREQWKYYDQAIQHRSQERQQGSWDCPQCTVVNPPYTGICTVCRAKAPPHVLSFEPMLSSQKFGVELEIVLPNGKLDGFTLESLATSLTLLMTPSQKVKFCGYTHETMECWKIVTDASIQSTNAERDLCFELVSPVLVGEPGLVELRTMLESIRKLGIATNATCGFHVHVDATHVSLESLQCIGRCFTGLEDAFDLLVARSWDHFSTLRNNNRRANGNKYCQSNRLAFGEMSNQQRWNRIGEARSVCHLVKMLNPNMDRYRKLNLANIVKDDRPSTIEYRNHGCVEELIEAEAWVRLVVRFTQNASSRCEATDACLLAEDSDVRTQLDRLFDVVGCGGLEQYFCVERRLFRGQTISNDWSCATCRRSFASSRSLSQHCRVVGHS